LAPLILVNQSITDIELGAICDLLEQDGKPLSAAQAQQALGVVRSPIKT